MRFLADLALFVEVANTRNFSRAAAALGMPVSTLSRRISVLERELGFRLIHRSTRVFKLTDAGQACYEQSKALVAEATRIQEEVAGTASRASGHIRVGVPFDLAQTIFLPLFARYMLDHPDISIEVLSISGHPNLLTESLDLAMMVSHQCVCPILLSGLDESALSLATCLLRGSTSLSIRGSKTPQNWPSTRAFVSFTANR
jgi:LysR family transcriptional regulator, regulator for bpeEF and oprC